MEVKPGYKQTEVGVIRRIGRSDRIGVNLQAYQRERIQAI